MTRHRPDNRLGGLGQCNDELLNDLGQLGERDSEAGDHDILTVSPCVQGDPDHAFDDFNISHAVKENLLGGKRIDCVDHSTLPFNCSSASEMMEQSAAGPCFPDPTVPAAAKFTGAS